MKVFGLCLSGDIDAALSNIDNLINEGYNAYDIVNVICRVIEDTPLMDEEFRCELLKENGEIKMKVLEGYDSLAQLYGYIAIVCEKCSLMNKN
jgi:replication factor C subunit 2/4